MLVQIPIGRVHYCDIFAVVVVVVSHIETGAHLVSICHTTMHVQMIMYKEASVSQETRATSSTMKFTIAASTILAQTLPARALSDKSVSSNRWPHHQEEEDVSSPGTAGDIFQFLSALQKEPQLMATTTTNLRKRLSGLLQDRRRESRKLLTNNTSTTLGPSTKPCEPTFTDADIGHLACGWRLTCVVDEASRMGGTCVALPPGALLPNGSCDICSHGMGISQLQYDIIIEDVESGYGGKTCKDIIEAAYFNMTIDADRCPGVSKAALEAGCCKPVCDLCKIGQKIPEENDNIAVNVPIAGNANTTCGSLWKASYWYAAIDVESCPRIRQAAMDAGCCAQYECITCGFRSYIRGDSSAASKCADVKTAAYVLNATISSEVCSAALQLAQDEDCCTPVRTYDSCDFCGEATFYPDNWVFKIGSCSYIQSLFSEAFCAKYTPVYAPFCCGPVPEGTEPTEEATKEPAGSSPTSPPSSAATMTMTWASTGRSALVSIMIGLTAIAAEALMMNGYLMFSSG